MQERKSTLMRSNSRLCLDMILENRDCYITKLGSALNAHDANVNKQVFELLSALCAYNADGYNLALEALEHYKIRTGERYRFKIIVSELEKAVNSDYQVCLLTLVNCLVISAPNLQDRIRIRNELIGLKVLPLLNNLRKVAHSVGNITEQLEVFEEQRECDEAESLQGPSGINLNSHLDVFYAILRQVAESPQEVPFLSLLQHLLRIDPKEAISDVIWDAAEKLVHRATLLENNEDARRLLRIPNNQNLACANCRLDATSPTRRQSELTTISTPSTSTMATSTTTLPHSPVITTMNTSINQKVSPTTSTTTVNAAPPPPRVMAAPPPPPAPVNVMAQMQPNLPSLPQQAIPAPKSKMKTINWAKIPHNKLLGKENVWTIVAHTHQNSPMSDIDWTEIESLFCLQSTKLSAQGSPKLGREGSSTGYDTLDRKCKKENSEIALLDGKRSLNVNIFLKQFRNSKEDTMEMIRNGNHSEFTAEQLRGLLKLLPRVDEIDLLKSFNGDRSRLGDAEKFLLQMLEIPNYKLRIESMLLKKELAPNIDNQQSCISAMIAAADDLMNNKMLQEVLYMIVVAGNFLNSGGYAGNAAGVKLSSLQKLTDIRANKPGMNLVHYVAMQARRRNPMLLEFATNCNNLDTASKTTPEQVSNDIKTLSNRISIIKSQVENSQTDDDIKQQMHLFLQDAEESVDALKTGMKSVEEMRLKLSDFFCEDPTVFKLDECFKVFQSFCNKFKEAVLENERREQQENREILRKKQRQEQLAKRAQYGSNQSLTPISDSEYQLMSDPRASPALPRRYIPTPTSGVDVNTSFQRYESNESMTSDTTPNGSLRRRISRDPHGKDLMEFLQKSNEFITFNRDRTIYGSLDRGKNRPKRPDRLSAEFSTDRERASSPAPSDNRTSPLTPQSGEVSLLSPQQTDNDNKPKISNKSKQIIKTWIQDNNDKQNDEHLRERRLVNLNRRSLENDNESERKLDTLPEEKVGTSTPTIGSHNLAMKNSDETLSFKRTHKEPWQPSKTLDTDVVGNVEAIADIGNSTAKEKQHAHRTAAIDYKSEMQQQQQQQHKRHINNNNNARTGTAETRSPEQRSEYCGDKQCVDSTTPNEQTEDRRRTYIQGLAGNDSADRLYIYVRRPSQKEIDGKPQTPDTTKTPTVTAKILNYLKSNSMENDVVAASPLNCKHFKKEFYSNERDKAAAKMQDDTFASLLNHHKSHNEKYSHKEIDADNIETPPLGRKLLNPANLNAAFVDNNRNSYKLANGKLSADANYAVGEQAAAKTTKTHENVDVALEVSPTYFDRHADIRRTRRFKRPTDYSSGNEDAQSSQMDVSESNNDIAVQQTSISYIDNASEPKRQQNVLQTQKESPISSTKRTIIPLHKLEKMGRHFSSINQEDVQEAIRNLKSPTDTPERIWSPSRETVSSAFSMTSNAKITNLELNDEGFETQSLVSDTPSQGKDSTNSSCNEACDMAVHTQQLNRNSMAQKSNIAAKTSVSNNKLVDNKVQISKLRPTTAMARSHNSSAAATANGIGGGRRAAQLPATVERVRSASSVAAHTQQTVGSAAKRSSSVRRTATHNSLHKAASQQQVANTGVNANKRDVERSSSRNSLRSSRSSINSAVSAQTVRHMPVIAQGNKTTLQTASVDSSPSKRPLTTQNVSINRNVAAAATPAARSNGVYGGTPASRSSSSGSSVDPHVLSVRKKLPTANQRTTTAAHLTANTSFKENQKTVPASITHARQNNPVRHNTILVKTSMLPPPAPNTTNTKQGASARTHANSKNTSSFMRHTAASATKRNK